MSVIVRMEDGLIKIICKGADTVMLPRLRIDYPGAQEVDIPYCAGKLRVTSPYNTKSDLVYAQENQSLDLL